MASVNSEVLFLTQIPSVNDTYVLPFITPGIKNETSPVLPSLLTF
jgi:hypothetical protein